LFTGLIQDVGLIRQVERRGELVLLAIQTSLSVGDFQLGESIAVDGICLTVVVYAANMFGDALRDLLDPRMRGSR